MQADTTTLAPCPFCNAPANIKAVARDWWKLSIDHADGCVLSGHFDEVIVPQDDESKADIIARWNRRVPNTQAPTDADVARLRFFRDLTEGERIKVLNVFGAIPPGAESEVTSHYIERRLFDRMLAKWGAPAPASGEAVAIYRGRCVVDCGEHGHHDIELLKMIPAGSNLYTAPPAQEALVPLKVREFEEWLNDHRGASVSEVFHDVVAHYKAARSIGITAAQKEGNS